MYTLFQTGLKARRYYKHVNLTGLIKSMNFFRKIVGIPPFLINDLLTSGKDKNNVESMEKFDPQLATWALLDATQAMSDPNG